MKEIFVNNSLNYLKKNNVCDSKQEKIFKYTLETLYSFCTKTFIILCLSFIFRTFQITLYTLILYSILRGFTFGIHATKNIYCWIITLSVYIFLPFIINNYDLSNYFIYFSFMIGQFAILIWAPADTKARPLLNPKKRLFNKLIAFSISSLYILIGVLCNKANFKEIIAIIFLINTICICPITYYIFKQPYNNYLYYKKD